MSINVNTTDGKYIGGNVTIKEGLFNTEITINNGKDKSIVEKFVKDVPDNHKNDHEKVKELVIANECAPGTKGRNDPDGICTKDKYISRLGDFLESKFKTPLLGDKKKIIKKAMEKTDCGSESCLYSHGMLKGVLPSSGKDEFFNPKGPHNNEKWLSNEDIDDVLDKWNKIFPEYIHIDCHMNNFEDHAKGKSDNNSPELAVIKWKKIIDNGKYKKLGCVINTDNYGDSGQHWVSIFVDLPGRSVEYFDSAAGSMSQEMLDFVSKTASTLLDLTGHLHKERYLHVFKHQRQNNECGMYSLFYQLCRIHEVSPDYFESVAISDELMNNFRRSLFRWS